MKIDVMVASEKHLKYVTTINDTIDEAAKARGTGIARRTDEYITGKIKQGKAIIALNREEIRRQFRIDCKTRLPGNGGSKED